MEVANDELAGLAGKEVAECQIDGLHRGGPAKDVAADGEHDHHERKKGEESAGRDCEGVDVSLGLHQVMEGRTETGPPGADIREAE